MWQRESVRALQIIFTLGFLRKLSTIDDVMKYRGIPVFLWRYIIIAQLLIPSIPSPDPHVKEQSGRPRTCPDMSGGRYTQSDSAGGRTSTVRMPILTALDGVHIGTTWRMRLNHPHAAAIRPYVKILWPPVITAIIMADLVCISWDAGNTRKREVKRRQLIASFTHERNEKSAETAVNVDWNGMADSQLQQCNTSKHRHPYFTSFDHVLYIHLITK